MFRGMFGGRSEGSEYADIIGMGTFRLRTREQTLLAVLTVLGFIWALGLPASSAGTVSEMGADGQSLSACTDLSAVPPSVADDAARLALNLFGRQGEESDRFVDELLATYVRSQDKEVVVFFSPGGWGAGPMDMGRPWGSILGGMQSQLSDSGSDSLILTYQRSEYGLLGCCEEFSEILRDYSFKAEVLASRVELLTSHIPDLKVVIVGESTGAQIGGEALGILSENPQVFGIEIGPPCWYRHASMSRTLIIADNGFAADSFSRGDVFTIVKANMSALFGGSSSKGDRGTVLKYLKAPGHDYWWDYPAVSSQITRFLEENVRTGRQVTATATSGE